LDFRLKIKRIRIKKRLIFVSMDYLLERSLMNMIFFYNYTRKVDQCLLYIFLFV
jgi:hypothetical protein